MRETSENLLLILYYQLNYSIYKQTLHYITRQNCFLAIYKLAATVLSRTRMSIRLLNKTMNEHEMTMFERSSTIWS